MAHLSFCLIFNILFNDASKLLLFFFWIKDDDRIEHNTNVFMLSSICRRELW